MLKYSVLLLLLVGIQCIFSFDCCVPDQWSGTSLTMQSNELITKKNYYYDATNLRVRIDTIVEEGGFNQTTFSSYASLTVTGSEWVLDNIAGTCQQTGPDYWNSQCFGDSYGLPFVKSIGESYVFANPSNGLAVTTSTTCIPQYITSEFSLSGTQFINTQASIADDSVFSLPSVCKSSK